MITEARFWRSAVLLAVFGATAFLIFHVWSVLIPFLLGCVIAYLVSPLVDQFVARGLRRDRVVLVLYIFLLGITILLGSLLLPALYREANSVLVDLPSYTNTLNGFVEEINLSVQKILSRVIGAKAHQFSFSFRADKFFEGLFSKLPYKLIGVAHLGVWILIIPFVSFFGLSHGKQWIDKIFDLTPSEYVESLLGLMAEVNATLGGYIRGVLLESGVVGLMIMVGLLILGVDGAVLLGFVSMLLNFVPFMAALVGGFIALLTAYFQHQSLPVLVGIFFLFVGVRLFDDFVVVPFVVGQHVKLHPVVMVFAVLAGMELGGLLGAVFAIPTAAVIKVVMSILFFNRRQPELPHKHHVFS